MLAAMLLLGSIMMGTVAVVSFGEMLWTVIKDLREDR